MRQYEYNSMHGGNDREWVMGVSVMDVVSVSVRCSCEPASSLASK